ncbi:MAG TPA: ABC transporter permease [Steroidobacteraceae bacterium]|nr:ABC transporter permease [Steroidobacteraceae bacterium]
MSAWGKTLRRTWAIAAKEFRQLSRDRLTFGMVVGIPLIQILIFGYSINFDVRDIGAGVVDLANTSASRALIADLEATQVIRVEERLRTVAELEARIASGALSAGVYIPPDFERRKLDPQRTAVQVLVDGSEPTIEGVVRALANIRVPGRAGSSTLPSRLIEVRTLYNPEKRTPVQIVPALIGVILTLTMVVFTAVAIVRERERGNMELLITTPVKSGELMMGKLIPYVLVGLIQTTLILLVGVWLFNVPVVGSLIDLYIAAAAFIAANLMLGLVISTLAQTQFQAIQLSIFTLLPSILLSGFMFPFDGMPRVAQWIAQILPLTHFVELVRGIVLRGAPLGALWLPLTKLGIFFAIAMAVAATRFRKRLD